MKTLTIQDLSRTEDLGRAAMSAIHGGMHKEPKLPYWVSKSYDASKHDFSLDVSQVNAQSQNIANNNGVNVAFADDIRSTITPTQRANNSVNVF